MRKNKRAENKRPQEMMEGRGSQTVLVDLICFLLEIGDSVLQPCSQRKWFIYLLTDYFALSIVSHTACVILQQRQSN